MLYASIVFNHAPLPMNQSHKVREALVEVFGEDQCEIVLAQSQLLVEDAQQWRDKVCFGCFHLGSSVFFMRNSADQLVAHLEIGPTVRAQDLASMAYSNASVALSKSLRLRPKLERILIKPEKDTSPILRGQSNLKAHFLNRSFLEVVCTGMVGVVMAIVGSTVIWKDQDPGLWSSAAPGAVISLGAILRASASTLRGRLHWSIGTED